MPLPIARAAHLFAHAAAMTPDVSHPYEKIPGLWNIPGSTLLMHRAGPRRIVSRHARLRRARLGLRNAETSGGTFHLWTHPFNLANDAPYMLNVLETILQDAVRARDQGRISIDSIGAVATYMESTLLP